MMVYESLSLLSSLSSSSISLSGGVVVVLSYKPSLMSIGSVAGGGDIPRLLLDIGCVGGGVADVCRFCFFGVADGTMCASGSCPSSSSSLSICTSFGGSFTARAAVAARPFDTLDVDLFFRIGAFGGCPMPPSDLRFFCCGGVTAMESPKSLITKSGMSSYSSGNA